MNYKEKLKEYIDIDKIHRIEVIIQKAKGDGK